MAQEDAVQKEIEGILYKNNMKYGFVFKFPRYSELPELPEEVRLAMAVLGRHGMKISLVIKSQTGEQKKP